jgi:hypothetical protein
MNTRPTLRPGDVVGFAKSNCPQCTESAKPKTWTSFLDVRTRGERARDHTRRILAKLSRRSYREEDNAYSVAIYRCDNCHHEWRAEWRRDSVDGQVSKMILRSAIDARNALEDAAHAFHLRMHAEGHCRPPHSIECMALHLALTGPDPFLLEENPNPTKPTQEGSG